MGCHKILSQYNTTTPLVDHPPKIRNPTNGSLFYFLPPDVIAAINNWLISLEYHDKYKNVPPRIKSQGNPILYTILYD